MLEPRVVILAVGLVFGMGSAQAQPESSPARPSDGRAERLAASYDSWRAARYPDADKYRAVVPLGFFRGVSAMQTTARGMAVIDMRVGSVEVEVGGMDSRDLVDIWLVDNRPGPGAGAMPNAGDEMRHIGSLEISDGYGALRAEVGREFLRDFDIDVVVVARRGEDPLTGGVLYGALPLFERLYRASNRLAEGLTPIAGDEESRGTLVAAFPVPSVRAADSPGALALLAGLLEDGEVVFNEETFDGNGRTCATCHPPSNNFTLDKEFISRLRPNDPLFVAEFIRDLNHELNGGLFFENPVLMREFALIVANPDGFDDLANKFVMRSPNHIFAQALSIEPADFDQTAVPPNHRLGWGGDGAPGSGTLREFAIGAVIQHAPLTLGRVDGEDFRLPTDEELDAMEAFQFSLGRQEELDLASMVFTDPDVAAGNALFLTQFGFEGGARCHRCHGNAGALRPPDASISPSQNGNFDIGIFNVEHPASDLGEPMPFDDGFGSNPNPGEIGAGLNTFSTSSIIEAADTAPFFHDNAFLTLEGAIGHYSSDEFNHQSQAGISMQRDGDPIDLTQEEINQVGALLRVLNALQNIKDIQACHDRVIASSSKRESRRLLRLCIADNRDAVDVLSDGPLAPLHSVALGHLGTSIGLHRQATSAPTLVERDAILATIAVELAAARADMVDEAGP